MEILKAVFMVIGFCCLLFLAYVAAKYAGSRQSKAAKGKHISIVETVALGLDKRIHLIKAGSSYVLIATTAKTVEFLGEVSLDAVLTEELGDHPDRVNAFDFREIFDKYIGALREKKTGSAEGEVKPFRDQLIRLRNIAKKIEGQVKKDGDVISSEKNQH